MTEVSLEYTIAFTAARRDRESLPEVRTSETFITCARNPKPFPCRIKEKQFAHIFVLFFRYFFEISTRDRESHAVYKRNTYISDTFEHTCTALLCGVLMKRVLCLSRKLINVFYSTFLCRAYFIRVA